MRRMSLPACAYYVAALLTLGACRSDAQAVPAPTAAPPMTAEQQAEFGTARADFGASRWAAALATLRRLHEERPGDAVVAKFAAEAAINTGDAAYAESLLQPVEAAASHDWQSRALVPPELSPMSNLHVDVTLVPLTSVLECDGGPKQPLHLIMKSFSVSSFPSPGPRVQADLAHKCIQAVPEMNTTTFLLCSFSDNPEQQQARDGAKGIKRFAGFQVDVGRMARVRWPLVRTQTD